MSQYIYNHQTIKLEKVEHFKFCFCLLSVCKSSISIKKANKISERNIIYWNNCVILPWKRNYSGDWWYGARYWTWLILACNIYIVLRFIFFWIHTMNKILGLFELEKGWLFSIKRIVLYGHSATTQSVRIRLLSLSLSKDCSYFMQIFIFVKILFSPYKWQ